MLILPIKKQWYDMILSGEKKEEYREIKPYYTKRFDNQLNRTLTVGGKKGTVNEWLRTDIKHYLDVKFRNGYSSTSPSFDAKCQLVIDKGRPEWGAEPGKEYYVLKVIQINDK